MRLLFEAADPQRAARAVIHVRQRTGAGLDAVMSVAVDHVEELVGEIRRDVERSGRRISRATALRFQRCPRSCRSVVSRRTP